MRTLKRDLSPWMPWAVVASALALGLAVWEVFPPGIWHDDGVYVLLGRSLAEGEGLRYVGVEGAPLAPKFPPLYPLLLAGVWALFPSFPENLPLLSGANLVVLAAASGVFFSFLRRGLRVPFPWALGVTVLAWVSPQLWRAGMVPLSEPSFLLALLVALWAGVRMETGQGGRFVLFFLVAAGLAVYVRTLGLAVLGAGVLSLLLTGRRKDASWVALGSVALVLPWVLWTRSAAAAIPDPLMDTLGPYGGWLVGQVLADPGGYALFMAGNAGHLLSRTLHLLLPGVRGGAVWVGLLLIPPLLLGLVDLYGRSRTILLALGLSFLILLVWPFQDIRLLAPYQPLLMLATALGFRALIRGGWRVTIRKEVWASMAGVWVALVVFVSLGQLLTGWPARNYRIRSEALVTAAQAVADHTPADALVGAPELWSGIHLLTGRTVVPSARFRPLAAGGPPGGTPEEQYELWIMTGLTHVVVEHGGQVHGVAVDRIDALCPPGTIQLLDNRPGQFLVGLNWDSDCQERVLSEH